MVSHLKRGMMRQIKDSPGMVRSSQDGVHPNLERHVRRHLHSGWMQPLHRPTLAAYARLKEEGVLAKNSPLVLDSGCGTGASTRRLALRFPQSTVVGVDQSKARLAKSGVSAGFQGEENCFLLRAELATFWRLLAADGISLDRHFLLYPNPWPKPGHLTRRWHGHPVFPHLLALEGEIELRCNWEVYAKEFALAVELATGAKVGTDRIQPEAGISPFEKKYLERGQSLYRVRVPGHATTAFKECRDSD